VALLISDTNILIDFEDGGLLESLFGLPESVGVPDLLFESELRDRHSHLVEHGLVLVELTAVTLTRVVELAGRYGKPSRLDLAALAAAEQEACPLLTGDQNLRSAAEAEGVEFHGTLWVAERLAAAGVVTVAELRAAYARMKANGRRLPWAEAERRLARLEGSS
jgi:hypothetical protein